MGQVQGGGGLPDQYSYNEVMMTALSDILKRAPVFKDKIFITALVVSLLWHVLWISVFKVVIGPGKAQPVKFSKVSFFGPAQSKMAIEARIVSHESSFLEQKYLESIKKRSVKIDKSAILEKSPPRTENAVLDKRVVQFVSETVGGSKEEPPVETGNYF